MNTNRLVLLSVVALAVTSLVHAAESAVRITRDVAFLGPDRAEKLDLYLPQGREAGVRSPALVWIHGGGFMIGRKNEKRAQEICTTAAEAGYVAVSIDYKLRDGAWPQNLFDCKNAVRFLRAHAAEYRIDPDRIAVAGGSAGGHLALMVAFTSGKAELESEGLYPGVSSAVRCVIDMYGITDLRTPRLTDANDNPTATAKKPSSLSRVFGATTDDDDVLRIASPVTHVTEDSPPVLILHGRADTSVGYPQSEELARLLKQHDVEYEMMLFDGVGHTFGLTSWKGQSLPRDLRPVVLAFLAKHMK